MLDIRIFKLIHLVSIMALFLAFGAAMLETIKFRWIALLHGIALLLILITGFGMLALLGVHGQPPAWAMGKFGIWILFGLSLVFAKRKLVPKPALATWLFLLGAGAAFLALWKP